MEAENIEGSVKVVESQGAGKPVILTQELAQAREKQLFQNSVSYNLFLHLEKKKFSGNVLIQFFCAHNNTDLLLEFDNQAIDRLIINGSQLFQRDYWDGKFITLPRSLLLVNRCNSILVDFSCQYSSTSLGLFSYSDKSDDTQYVYSQGEPYYSHLIFPQFDQPSIKATFQLTVRAPESWVILSNEPQLKVQIAHSDNSKIVQFSKSKPLPTYVLGIVAGDFQSIEWLQTYRNIPMKLYCRKKYLEGVKNHISEFLKLCTDKAFELFENLTGIDYSFLKYDQILVPHYSHGAMENCGLVVFAEFRQLPQKPTALQYSWLARVISHELSHHWFGNLVTMRWWNDIWLNESFADFMSEICCKQVYSAIESIADQCLDFTILFHLRKKDAFETDESSYRTHPLHANVPNVYGAEKLFDTIMYNKGAVVLTQLMALLGFDRFWIAVRSFLRNNAFLNADDEQFFANFEEQFQALSDEQSCLKNSTLREWRSQWIEQHYFEILVPQRNVIDGQQNITILQINNLENQQIRTHRIKIAFFNQNAKLIHIQQVILGEKAGNSFVYDGKEPFSAILINYNHETYAKTHLDQDSLYFFTENMSDVQDLQSRAIIWEALFTMLSSEVIQSDELLDILDQQILHEKMDYLAKLVLDETVNECLRQQTSNQDLLQNKPLLREELENIKSLFQEHELNETNSQMYE